MPSGGEPFAASSEPGPSGKVGVVDMTVPGKLVMRVFDTDEEAKAFLDSLSARSAELAAETAAFASGPEGRDLVNGEANRLPAHLIPARDLFAAMPGSRDTSGDRASIRRAWRTYRASGGSSGLEFLSTFPDLGLSSAWESYTLSEQRYMEAWAVVNSEAKRVACVEAPKTADEVVDALCRAVDEYARAYSDQFSRDSDSLSGYSNLRLGVDPPLAKLLAESCCSEGVRCGFHTFLGCGYLTIGGRNTNLTCCSAGYLAAAASLNSSGIGCAPYASWD